MKKLSRRTFIASAATCVAATSLPLSLSSAAKPVYERSPERIKVKFDRLVLPEIKQSQNPLALLGTPPKPPKFETYADCQSFHHLFERSGVYLLQETDILTAPWSWAEAQFNGRTCIQTEAFECEIPEGDPRAMSEVIEPHRRMEADLVRQVRDRDLWYRSRHPKSCVVITMPTQLSVMNHSAKDQRTLVSMRGMIQVASFNKVPEGATKPWWDGNRNRNEPWYRVYRHFNFTSLSQQYQNIAMYRKKFPVQA